MRFLEWLIYGKLVERPDYMEALADIGKLRYAGFHDVSYEAGTWGRRHMVSNHVQGSGSDIAEELYRRIAGEPGNASIKTRKRSSGIIIELTDGYYHRKFMVSLHSRTS